MPLVTTSSTHTFSTPKTSEIIESHMVDQNEESSERFGKVLILAVSQLFRFLCRRQIENNALRLSHKTFITVFIGISGFISQFQGLRFSNWTCSIAQLIAIGIATILRAFVRRGMTKVPVAVPVEDDYIIDIMTLAIVSKRANDRRFPKEEAFWSPRLSLAFGVTSAPILRSKALSGSKSQVQPPKETEVVPNIAQRALDLRVRLGLITRWTGPKAQNAITVSNSIDSALETLSPQLPAQFGEKCVVIIRIDTCQVMQDPPAAPRPGAQEESGIHINQEEVELTITKDGDKQKVDDSQLEALLSLVSYSSWAAEQNQRRHEAKHTQGGGGGFDGPHGPNSINSAGRGLSEKQSVNDSQFTGWLRTRAKDKGMCNKIVGISNPRLLCDLFWWIPNMDQVLKQVKVVHNYQGNRQLAISTGTPNGSDTQSNEVTKLPTLGFCVDGEISENDGMLLPCFWVE